MVSMILILAQVLILRKQSHFVDTVLQIPISFLFAYVIDFSTWLLTCFNPENYGVKLISLLIGCLIIAFGVYFEVVANVAILPADGFSRAIAVVTKKEFGAIKLLTDSSIANRFLTSHFFSGYRFLCLHEFAGVREGIIISALLIGNIIKLIGKTWQLERVFSSW